MKIFWYETSIPTYFHVKKFIHSYKYDTEITTNIATSIYCIILYTCSTKKCPLKMRCSSSFAVSQNRDKEAKNRDVEAMTAGRVDQAHTGS